MADNEGAGVEGLFEGAAAVELRCCDLAGRSRAVGLRAEGLDAGDLAAVPVDVAGWPGLPEGATLALNVITLALEADLTSAFDEPFAALPTKGVFAELIDADSGQAHPLDPRAAARAYQDSAGLGDAAIALEFGFRLFEGVSVESMPGRAGYALTLPDERRDDPNGPVRAEIAAVLAGLGYERLRHAQAPGAAAHDIAFAATGLLEACDRLQLAKRVVAEVALSYGKAACFLSLPLAGEAPSSLRVRIHPETVKPVDPVAASLFTHPTLNSRRAPGGEGLDPACNPYLALPAWLASGGKQATATLEAAAGAAFEHQDALPFPPTLTEAYAVLKLAEAASSAATPTHLDFEA